MAPNPNTKKYIGSMPTLSESEGFYSFIYSKVFFMEWIYFSIKLAFGLIKLLNFVILSYSALAFFAKTVSNFYFINFSLSSFSSLLSQNFSFIFFNYSESNEISCIFIIFYLYSSDSYSQTSPALLQKWFWIIIGSYKPCNSSIDLYFLYFRTS